MTEKLKQILTDKWAYMGYGILLSVLLIMGIRFATYHVDETHYHANFAVYINGEREQFKGSQYYQEVQICSLHDTITPVVRAHMHDNQNGVVHVHDEAVTWGQFFDNLGWSIGPDFIRTTSTLYVTDDINQLNIMLNGENLTGISSIANQVIGDRDRLLISYGTIAPTQLAAEYATVPNTAKAYDEKNDPASCSGAEAITLKDRLKHLF